MSKNIIFQNHEACHGLTPLESRRDTHATEHCYRMQLCSNTCLGETASGKSVLLPLAHLVNVVDSALLTSVRNCIMPGCDSSGVKP